MNSRDHQTPKLKRKKYLPLLHQYALQFNGTDEYLTRALPVNLLTGNRNDYVSAGTMPAGFSASGATWNQTGITGSTSTNVVKLTGTEAFIMYTGLTVGKKYKLRVRWFGDSALRIGSTAAGADYATVAVTTQWNTVIRTFTALSTSIAFSMASGTGYIDFLNFTEDWKLDLNESWELIKHSNNRDFEGTDIAFTGTGNHSAVRSTVDKYEGTGSLKITATGAGDSGSNYISLPSAQIDTLVSGNKYTPEFFAKTDPTSLNYGSDLASGWNFTSGWTAGGGVTIVDNNSYTGVGVWKSLCTIGKVYKLIFSASATIGTVEVYNMAGNDTNKVATGNGTFYFTAVNASLYIRNNNGTGQTDVATFELYEATPITFTKQIGTKSVTITPSITSYTKGVLNFECTASEVGQDLKMYLSGAGSVYVDNVSLTQAYDWGIKWTDKIFDNGSDQTLIAANTNQSATNLGFFIYRYNSDNFLSAFMQDGSGNGANIVNNLHNDNETADYLYLINRTSNATGYKNNTLYGTNASGIGKVIFAMPFTIGKRADGNSSYFAGQIAFIQIIRFTNIFQSNFNPNTYKPGYPVSGGGAEVVFWFDPKNGSSVANMLQDYSGNGNNLSAVNMDLTNRVIVRK